MRVGFELLALFRQKAGTDRLEIEVEVGSGAEVPFGAAPCKAPAAAARAPGGEPTVLAALRAAETRFGGQPLLDGEKLRQGVLVFVKDSEGATRRIFHPSEERVRAGQVVVLSTAMGGG